MSYAHNYDLGGPLNEFVDDDDDFFMEYDDLFHEEVMEVDGDGDGDGDDTVMDPQTNDEMEVDDDGNDMEVDT